MKVSRVSGTRPFPLWRWWVLWVMATNIGWFGGLGLGIWLSGELRPAVSAALDPKMTEVVLATVPGVLDGIFVGVCQWLVLRRKLSSMGGWIPATAIGWPVGAFVAAWAIFTAFPGTEIMSVRYIVGVAAAGGLMVGIPQQRVLAGKVPGARWWVPISVVGWAIQFPGMLPGLWLWRGLARRANSES